MFRPNAPAPDTFPSTCYQGGRLYRTREGDEIFVPMGASRKDIPAECGKVTYLGVCRRNVVGWDANGTAQHPPQLLP